MKMDEAFSRMTKKVQKNEEEGGERRRNFGVPFQGAIETTSIDIQSKIIFRIEK